MNGALEPFRTEPLYVEKTWGSGERLRTTLQLPAPPSTGEVWLVSDVAGSPSKILDGPYAGRSLADLMRERPLELVGDSGVERFPLLIKLLEISDRLSVQVHPDAATAEALGDGALGKSEAWFVLDVGSEGRVYLGLKEAIDPQELPSLSEAGLLGGALNQFRPEVGEGIEIMPGTFHTAQDLLLLEVQETCDLTYRVYDWGRPRELHLAQAQACLERIPRAMPPRQAPFSGGRQVLTRETPFSFEVIALAAGEAVDLSGSTARAVVVLEGSCQLESLRLLAGQSAVLPASSPQVELVAEVAAKFGFATAAAPASS